MTKVCCHIVTAASEGLFASLSPVAIADSVLRDTASLPAAACPQSVTDSACGCLGAAWGAVHEQSVSGLQGEEPGRGPLAHAFQASHLHTPPQGQHRAVAGQHMCQDAKAGSSKGAWPVYLIGQAEAELGEQHRHSGREVHARQALPHAVARAQAEGEEALGARGLRSAARWALLDGRPCAEGPRVLRVGVVPALLRSAALVAAVHSFATDARAAASPRRTGRYSSARSQQRGLANTAPKGTHTMVPAGMRCGPMRMSRPAVRLVPSVSTGIRRIASCDHSTVKQLAPASWGCFWASSTCKLAPATRRAP